ncbi:SIS domain-containing protein [Streptantibioticus rubrisoli]|uniref:SIS domain-containing protein n=1 Tax=Streptantibioticus rubrisoli TaxID=1387313 RepID=A0ABT1P837_9ACTN|nr:SIS domain-containing protein [Streptantibioticus rubrisoli]MCQ4040500.1 SIS domain-containing protein [Streptantibioticus rubrisoli]
MIPSQLTRPGSRMDAEMRQQPEVLAALAERWAVLTAQVAALSGGTAPLGVAFLARGSSDHAALLGRYAVELTTGLPTCLVAPSLATAYGKAPTGLRGWLLVALSQSGRTPEIVDLSRRYAAAGAKVIAVTNDGASELAGAAHLSIPLDAGPELAVPATKTVTGQLLAVLAIAAGLAPGYLTQAQAAALPNAVSGVLADTDAPERAARLLAAHNRLAVVGRGACYPAALEGALKLQETTGLMAHGWSTADFRHGPIAVCGPDAPALLLAGSGPADTDTLDVRNALAERRAPILLAGTAPGADLPWPALGHLGECIPATVRAQQLALATARSLGVDPDRPTGLNKVTLTS